MHIYRLAESFDNLLRQFDQMKKFVGNFTYANLDKQRMLIKIIGILI